ncbi:MAG TPA: two-component regulator propeller domain-containing protein, partial [Chryseolinea sp.]|nr:two-component regulator propeller domain-containing protein [Chryseolinea sp.]
GRLDSSLRVENINGDDSNNLRAIGIMNFVRKFFMGCSGITIVILVFFLPPAFAQELTFDHLSVKQGLSQANVWDIRQGKLGFIWIGTEDGLNMYDGYTFTIYRNNPADSTSISNSNVHCITEDRSGNLWVGTRLG